MVSQAVPLSPLASAATLVNIRNATSYPNPENAVQKPSVFCSKEPQHSYCCLQLYAHYSHWY